jgi:hypothetical protein
MVCWLTVICIGYLVKQRDATLEGQFILSDNSHRSSFKVLRLTAGSAALTAISFCCESGSTHSTLLQLKMVLYLPYLKKVLEIVSLG